MEAILIIIAVHSKNTNDIPGRLEIAFDSIEECERARSTINYELKFKQFIVQSQCVKKS